jgi:hypothetical protein
MNDAFTKHPEWFKGKILKTNGLPQGGLDQQTGTQK